MDTEEIGLLIRRLRKESDMTQKQVAEALNITEQAVSKWERGLGLPDISSLSKLSECLGVNISGLLDGELNENEIGEGKLKNMHFYICPKCENLILSTTECDISCCGRTLSRHIPRLANQQEEMTIQSVDSYLYITSSHPMRKDDYISFSAVINDGKAEIFSHYPEWNYEVRIPRISKGKIFWFSKKDGLKYQDI